MKLDLTILKGINYLKSI